MPWRDIPAGGRRAGLRLVLCAVLGLLSMQAASAETRRVAGADGPIEIVTDRWGIPHITATTLADAYFGQGYAAASARLWQMDTYRRRGLGRMAVALGADFLPGDEAARTVAFRGDLAADWARQAPGVEPLARAWVRGINARIAEVLADLTLLPPEFAALDYAPEPWEAEDLLRLRHSPAPNVRGEFRRALLACQGALGLDRLAHPLEPPHAPALPPGLEPCRLQPGQLALYDSLTAPSPWPRARRHGVLGPAGTAIALPSEDIDARQGSNAWVIAPGRSGTGRALLANDPHLAVGAPGPRFLTHLRAPGFAAIGAGPAFRPGFQFGHNGHIAFGRTDFQVDQEDLYILELDAAGEAYRTPTGWQRIERHEERIAVRGEAARLLRVGVTPLGPIIFEDRAARHALVLRAVQLQPGPSVALEYLAVAQVRNWAEYRAALRFAAWGSNYFYADVAGNIGWQTAGRVPRRRQHDGLLPVPAAGDYPWDGELPLEEMVGEYNPPRGWIASGNQMPFPPGWPAARITSWEWIADDRFRRLAQVLAAQDPHGPVEALALQQDVLSLRALRLRPLLEALPAAAPLRDWDARMDADSEPAALFALWWAEVGPAVRLAVVPEAARGALTVLHPHAIIALLLDEDPLLGGQRLPLASAALDRALARWRALPDRTWGGLHRVDLRHPMGALLPEANVLGARSGGDGATVMARWWASGAAPQVSGGASFRAVIELGQWDAVRGINLPGQSGDPRSPHYADLYPLWAAGETIPLGWERIEAESVVTLLPR